MNSIQPKFTTLASIGTSLRQLRRNHKLSQTELGLRSGLSRMPIYRLEAGQDVSLGSYLSMLQALGYSIELKARSVKPLHVDDLARAFAHLQDESEE